jgi:hypothetical protein
MTAELVWVNVWMDGNETCLRDCLAQSKKKERKLTFELVVDD